MEQANSIESYLRIVERFCEYKEFYYRGQLEKYQTILPSVARDEGYIENESSIFQEAVRLRADEFSSLHSPLQKLSKLQHYGIPTRLVDVTVDPLTALYFAVEDISDCSDGNVLFYLCKGHDFNSDHAKLLSVVATLSNHEIYYILSEYRKLFGKDIDEDTALFYIAEPIFIKQCKELKELNTRLFSQHGTFLICGNFIVDKRVTNKFKSLDTITPNTIIRIPYEYKRSILDELDKEYGINKTKIYPELPSVADYIKIKYRKDNFTPTGKYSILEMKDSSTSVAHRLSIVIVLNEQLRIDQVKTICVNIMDTHKLSQDVIWIYVAKTGEDYIVSNWVLRGQWISPNLDMKYQPYTLKEHSGKDFYWDSDNSYSTLSDFYNKYVFDTDIHLFVYYQSVWDEFKPIYNQLIQCSNKNNYNAFSDLIIQNENEIQRLYFLVGELGRSRNKEYDDFLSNYELSINAVDDLRLWRKRDDISADVRKHQYISCLNRANKYVELIDNDVHKWRIKIGIREEDFTNINIEDRPRPNFSYNQTLPINPNAINVFFKTDILILSDKRFKVYGTTNLFDFARLMLTVEQNRLIMGQDQADVNDGKFSFGIFGMAGIGYNPGTYQAEISLAIPSVQSKEFVKLAGIEYENMCGDYIDRTGVGPTANYKFEFTIN